MEDYKRTSEWIENGKAVDAIIRDRPAGLFVMDCSPDNSFELMYGGDDGDDAPEHVLNQGELRVQRVLDRLDELFRVTSTGTMGMLLDNVYEDLFAKAAVAMRVDAGRGLFDGPHPATTRASFGRVLGMRLGKLMSARNANCTRDFRITLPKTYIHAHAIGYALLEVEHARQCGQPFCLFNSRGTIAKFGFRNTHPYGPLTENDIKAINRQWMPGTKEAFCPEFISSMWQATSDGMVEYLGIDDPLHFVSLKPEEGTVAIGDGVWDIDDMTIRPYDPDRDLYCECFAGLRFETDSHHRIVRPDCPSHTYRGHTVTADSLVDRIANGSESKRLAIMHVLASIVKPSMCENKAIVLYGSGGNGKSTLLEVIRTAASAGRDDLDKRYVCSVTLKDMEDPVKCNPLIGKSFNICNELGLDGGVLRFTERMKSAITGETFSMKLLYHDPVDAAFNGRMFFASNSGLSSTDRSHGFWRRFLGFDFGDVTFGGSVDIPEVKKEFVKDPAVISYLVYRSVYETPQVKLLEDDPRIKLDTKHLRQESDSTLQIAGNVAKSLTDAGIDAVPMDWFYHGTCSAAAYISPDLKVPTQNKPAWTQLMEEVCRADDLVVPRAKDGSPQRFRGSVWCVDPDRFARVLDDVAPNRESGEFDLSYSRDGGRRHVGPSTARARSKRYYGWVVRRSAWEAYLAGKGARVPAADKVPPAPAPADVAPADDPVAEASHGEAVALPVHVADVESARAALDADGRESAALTCVSVACELFDAGPEGREDAVSSCDEWLTRDDATPAVVGGQEAALAWCEANREAVSEHDQPLARALAARGQTEPWHEATGNEARALAFARTLASLDAMCQYRRDEDAMTGRAESLLDAGLATDATPEAQAAAQAAAHAILSVPPRWRSGVSPSRVDVARRVEEARQCDPFADVTGLGD